MSRSWVCGRIVLSRTALLAAGTMGNTVGESIQVQPILMAEPRCRSDQERGTCNSRTGDVMQHSHVATAPALWS
jgi:hypothetical protein